jgi:hypothetical protein
MRREEQRNKKRNPKKEGEKNRRIEQKEKVN